MARYLMFDHEIGVSAIVNVPELACDFFMSESGDQVASFVVPQELVDSYGEDLCKFLCDVFCKGYLVGQIFSCAEQEGVRIGVSYGDEDEM